MTEFNGKTKQRRFGIPEGIFWTGLSGIVLVGILGAAAISIG